MFRFFSCRSCCRQGRSGDLNSIESLSLSTHFGMSTFFDIETKRSKELKLVIPSLKSVSIKFFESLCDEGSQKLSHPGEVCLFGARAICGPNCGKFAKNI